MEELRKKISAMVNEHFETKTKNFNFYDDTMTKNDVESVVDTAIENICDLLSDAERSVDYILENFDWRTAKREQIENEEIDRRYQYSVEERLGL